MTTLLVAGSARCTAACYEAAGPECTCPCGGVNHGVGLVRALAQAPELVDGAGQPLVAVLELPLREVAWDAGLTDDELRAALPPEELAPLLIDAAATVDLDARKADRLGREDEAAALDQLRDELVAEALGDAGPLASVHDGPRVAAGAAAPPQPAYEEDSVMPAKVDLRAPYTSEEWAAITTALKAERERRTKRGAPFTQAEQVAVINEAVRPMREALRWP